MKTASHQVRQRDTIVALVSIAAQPQQTLTSCPSDEQLADFITGNTTGAAREAMLQHLRHCPDCYALWQASEDCLQTAQPPAILLPKTRNNNLYTLRAWFRQWYGFTMPHYVLAGTVSLLLLVLTVPLLLPFWQSNPLLPTGLQAGYQRLIAYQGIAESAADLALPSLHAENTTFSFAPENAHTAAQLAFSAGLQEGQAILTQQVSMADGVWTDAATVHYYALGRWLVLTWAAAQLLNPPMAEFWQQQQQVLSELQAQLRGEDAELTRSLQTVATLLTMLPNVDNPAQYDQLARELQFLMHSYL